MEKSKKKKREQTTLERIVFGRKFGFYAPYTIEECTQLLLARREREPGPFASARKLMVTVNKESSDCYTFRLHKAAGTSLHAEVLGTLTRHEISTLVEGRGCIGIATLAFTALVAVLSLLFVSVRLLWVLAVLQEIMIGSFLLITAIERDRLSNLTCEILGKDRQV